MHRRSEDGTMRERKHHHNKWLDGLGGFKIVGISKLGYGGILLVKALPDGSRQEHVRAVY